LVFEEEKFGSALFVCCVKDVPARFSDREACGLVGKQNKLIKLKNIRNRRARIGDVLFAEITVKNNSEQ